MATTFVKNGTNVLVTIGDAKYSVPGNAFITPHPSEADAILISEKYNPQDREALKVFVSEVTTPEATDRNDLIEQLSTDFFFRVGSAFYGGFKTVQITGDGENTDYAMPVDCNISGPFIINNVPYSAALVLVSGVKKIRFSQVLSAEEFTVVAYTPTAATDPTTRKKQYTAYWTQTGTNAPVAVEQEDDIEPVLARSSAGVYTATKAGAFVEGKTVPISESYIDAETGNKMKMVRTSADVMTITTYLAADLETPADGVLTNQYVHFEIFN